MTALRNVRPWIAAALVCACGRLPHPNRSHESGDWTPGSARHDVEVGPGHDRRNYVLHIPDRAPRNRLGISQPHPLIIMLHGSSGNAEAAAHASQMDSVADAHGLLVAYPNGSKGRLGLFRSDWNAGECCGPASRDGADDVGFMRALIEEVAQHASVDRQRIYVAGFSDGGRMAYRIACEMAPVVAAIGVVSGSLMSSACAPARPVPVIAFHGTADDKVAYMDSARTPAPQLLAAWANAFPPAVKFWVSRNECTNVRILTPATHVQEAVFAPCRGADVSLYTIVGGVHGWPGEPPDGDGAEPPTSEVHATDVMIRFFLRHSR